MLISQLALFFFLLLFCATNGLSRGLQVRGSKEVLGRHLHIVLGLVKLRVVVAPLVVISPEIEWSEPCFYDTMRRSWIVVNRSVLQADTLSSPVPPDTRL